MAHVESEWAIYGDLVKGLTTGDLQLVKEEALTLLADRIPQEYGVELWTLAKHMSHQVPCYSERLRGRQCQGSNRRFGPLPSAARCKLARRCGVLNRDQAIGKRLIFVIGNLQEWYW